MMQSEFSQEIANAICLRLELGESLRNICKDKDLPAPSTVIKWTNQFPEFREQYARARLIQAELMADEILTIADNVHEDPQSRRGRVDARKWILSKVLPKVYGEATMLKHADADGNVLKIELSRVEPRPQKIIDVTPAPAALPPAPDEPGTPG
jgi:hypothetical protein